MLFISNGFLGYKCFFEFEEWEDALNLEGKGNSDANLWV